MSHCGRIIAPPLSRRAMLSRCANGFGALAMASLLTERGFGARLAPEGGSWEAGGLHHPAKARSVIFLYMDGGPSQVDTFDPKPRLDREHGQPIQARVEPTQFNNVGAVLRSPWPFRKRGESGIPVSDLFPLVGGCVDDLAVVRSMVSNFSEHTNANYFLHTCFGQQGRPSAGAWVTYGLGSESEDLPGFVVLNGGLIPPGGLDCFGNGFLPASYQGSVLKAGETPLANITPTEPTAEDQLRKLDLVRAMDRDVLARVGDHDAIESAIANGELAFRMQSAVPELTDLSGESPETLRLYGFDAPYPPTRSYARQCLLARRLVERGVRFVELTCPGVGHDRWDQHSNLKVGHEDNARAVDQPIAGLLRDLKGRGLLDSTVVVWGGEFGRTPMAQGTDGRDHNPFGFTMWLAGGGVKGGTIHGATDDYGYHAVQDKVEIYDLHATILHLLGIDHTRLTYRFSGRDMRLTDVHGRVVPELLA
ncbi:DUF1501 domain-containing protein [Tautonia sociabilis]|uniref:DUF1501 domain-containing protein n=1 Tax=Tautonia sociabilis TaxID=2080755 RepID=A0A432MHZ3_9BACT|nr:DUF1501 domain-containing protein [Tautonia sociabilis]RUL86733.1 DUF1501 domain-containing protein [Tautonia sociabilis]